jgi:hypothetical protein
MNVTSSDRNHHSFSGSSEEELEKESKVLQESGVGIGDQGRKER